MPFVLKYGHIFLGTCVFKMIRTQKSNLLERLRKGLELLRKKMSIFVFILIELSRKRLIKKRLNKELKIEFSRRGWL